MLHLIDFGLIVIGRLGIKDSLKVKTKALCQTEAKILSPIMKLTFATILLVLFVGAAYSWPPDKPIRMYSKCLATKANRFLLLPFK